MFIKPFDSKYFVYTYGRHYNYIIQYFCRIVFSIYCFLFIISSAMKDIQLAVNAVKSLDSIVYSVLSRESIYQHKSIVKGIVIMLSMVPRRTVLTSLYTSRSSLSPSLMALRLLSSPLRMAT